MTSHPNTHAYRRNWRPIPDRVRRRWEAWRGFARVHQRNIDRTGNTLLLYSGRSRFDGRRIHVIATGFEAEPEHGNMKTGPMVQLYIVPDEHPHTAAVHGREGSVCGTCPQRPSTGGRCYVTTQWAPSQVWRVAARQEPVRLCDARTLLHGAFVRVGAWGDPAAVPVAFWRWILGSAAAHTAYTHAWRELQASDWDWCMASVDTVRDMYDAQEAGWRTFRVDWDRVGTLEGERMCLAQQHRITCMSCGGCAGAGPKGRDWVIQPHGAKLGRPQQRARPRTSRRVLLARMAR